MSLTLDFFAEIS